MFCYNLKENDSKYIANTYKRANLQVESADGEICWNENNKKFVDFSSGIGVNSLGFSNDVWTDAVKSQLDKLCHISNLYYTEPQVTLAQKLCVRTAMERVFFCNSGAEANECAIKTARKYSSDKYGGERYEIVTLKNSFHGRTIATLSATGQDVFHKNFGPFVDGFVYAEANNTDSIQNCVSERTCAIMIELIQGEGGVIPLERGFVDCITKICSERDILLVVDEVQTGVGRTGKFLACDVYGIKPDIITLAKGLGGGLPIGAALFGEKTKDVLGFGDHGTTFGGNPVVCAGANVVLDTVDREFLGEVAAKGEYIRTKLMDMAHVVSVSGEGMMLGAQLETDIINTSIIAKCIENGLVLLSAKEKLRFLPPLNISYDSIDEGLEILEKVLEEQ